MTDTPHEVAVGDLSAMRVADLQTMASRLGIRGAARMRKVQLVEAIAAASAAATGTVDAATGSGSADSAPNSTADAEVSAADTTEAAPQRATRRRRATTGATVAVPEDSAAQTDAAQTAAAQTETDATQTDATQTDADRAATKRPAADQGSSPKASAEPSAAASTDADTSAEQTGSDASGTSTGGRSRGQQRRRRGERPAREESPTAAEGAESPLSLDDIVLPAKRDPNESDAAEGHESDSAGSGRKRNNRNRGKGDTKPTESTESEDSGSDNGAQQRGEGQNRRGGNTATHGRQRDRKRERREDADPEIAPDDVLVPIAGILDVLDNYAFVRTSGYLPHANDVYVSLGQVKKHGLRKGDAIVGAIRQPREGEHQSGRQKYNALVKIDTINGQNAEQARARAEFDSLTPLYPLERITLEADSGHAAQRMIDLFAPIGKGSRGLIIAPPKSGKSIILERIANAIAQNSPDTHLMLVLVDERPEEVTRLERTIHGEVVASTFDMPAENHTTIAELAIERAKRLVELGLDVVVLLDSITQLGRAYNLTAPASGRIIAGGVDASALYPAKRLFGAARKVENGGSLTILATAMVETGSRTDEVILEEFAGTGNLELRLSRELADKRIFPAVDIQQSSTLHEDQLLSQRELEATWAIRRALTGDAQGALEAVLERLSSTATNAEFVDSVLVSPIQAGR